MPSSSPSRSSDLERGRSACRHREWNVAYEALARADAAAPLEAEDLEILALSAFLVGREDEYAATLERAHQRHLEAGTLPAAARAAVWLGLHLAERGEMARASGWFGRAGRLVERIEGDCVEAGYLLLPAGIRGLAGGAYDEAYRLGGEAAERADRFGDRDLHALAVHLQGRARLRQGKVDEGLALLDEAMVGVAADELSPLVTGLIYCSVISACRDVYAVGRAHEWTEALSEWCERQPGMVAYTGECRVYRAELMQLHGAWHDAIEEARRATDRLGDGGGSAIGLAHYQEGEAYRLLGDLDAAEAAYRAASRAGREPQPGLALLRLARGDSDAAAAMLRRALAETEASLRRARLLPAYVEVLLEAGEPDDARRACEELVAIAARVGSAALDATAAHSRGAVALAEGDPESALVPLRRAAELWRELDAPYDAARARLLLGHACRALGDEESAALEIDAANAEFRRLGAGPDAARAVGAPSTPSGPRRTRPGHGLTPREREVLAELATGKTNRAIAESLFISEKTVARHVSNIFAKLDVSTRTAATAFAYEHEMLDPPA